MKRVWKNGIAFLMCIVMLLCVWVPTLGVDAEEIAVPAENAITAGTVLESRIVSEFRNPYTSISLTTKIALEELEKQMPSEMEVIFLDGSEEIIPVTWICECDYTNEDYDSYVFEVSLPEEYEMTETCSSAFVLVTLETYVSPETQKIYEANPNATVTIDEYLGVKRSVTQHLEDFEKRDYYLGTAYYSGFLTTGPDSCLVPKGESNYNGTTNGMNCTGFVARVLKNLGADITKITTRRDGHYANASNWNDFVDTYNIKSYRFTSISAMLASGVLQKGDIIYFEPNWSNAGADCHIGFFWGDKSNENRFWHSTAEYDNAITEIKSKSPIYYIYVFPVNHDVGDLEIYKASSKPELTDGNPEYSFEGAKYGVYLRDGYYTGEYAEPEYTITLDENGYGKIEGIPFGGYYIKELVAPKGYELDPNWYPSTPSDYPVYEVSSKVKVRVDVTDEPMEPEPYSLKIHKKDSDGLALSNAEFTLYEDEDLTSILAVGTTDEGVTTFDGLEIGKKYYIQETKAPEGYRPEVDDEGNRKVYEIYAEWADGIFQFYVNGTQYTSADTTGSIFMEELPDEGKQINIEVINQKGIRLPETGSEQMILLLGIGVILMLISISDKRIDRKIGGSKYEK